MERYLRFYVACALEERGEREDRAPHSSRSQKKKRRTKNQGRVCVGGWEGAEREREKRTRGENRKGKDEDDQGPKTWQLLAVRMLRRCLYCPLSTVIQYSLCL